MTTPSSAPAGAPPAGFATTSLTEAFRDVCERFRMQWRDGTGPTIEQILAGLPEDVRPLMLHRLLLVEIAEARAAGRSTDLTALRRRFPEERSVVDGAWEASWRTEAAVGRPSETAGPRRSGDTAKAAVVTDPGATRPLEAASPTMTTATRYSRFRQHRQGGMSILRIAHDEDLDRETVVKTLRPEYEDGEEFRRQLLAEASITGKLDHPGIVPVYGVGHDWDGRPFYTMRRIVGEDLHSHIARHHAPERPTGSSAHDPAPLDFRDLVEHLVDACNTIAYAHDAGVLHLDIKPQNVMVGRYGETFVVDWGLARPYERSTEFRNEPTVALRADLRGGVEAYTRPFVSPEQFVGGPLGPAADIYSLGATLYYLATGVTGLRGDEPDFRDRLVSGAIPPPRARRASVPKALDAICRRAMALQPADRYPTAKALAADLHAWLRDEPVAALPERFGDRLLRKVRRHAGIVATAGAALPVIAAALMAAALGWRQTEKLRVAADIARAATARADARFDTAVNTFESISAPLATANWSNTEVFREVAKDIETFSDGFLAEFRVSSATPPPPLQHARVHELKALAASVLHGQMSLDDLRKAEEFLLELSSSDADDGRNQRRLARNRLLQGQEMLRRERADGGPRTETRLNAGEVLENARNGFEKLKRIEADAFGMEEELLLAEVHHELGRWYLWLGDLATDDRGLSKERYGKSLEHFSIGRDIRQRLHERSPTEVVTRDLARSYGFRGDLYARQGKFSDALSDYEQSLSLRERLHTDHKSNIDYRIQYARGLANFVALELIHPDTLETTIQRVVLAADIQMQLLDDYRHNSALQREITRDLAWSYAAAADLKLVLGQDADEAADLARKAFLRHERDSARDDDSRRAKHRYRVLEAEARRDPAIAREALAFFEKADFADLDMESMWSVAVARGITGDTKGAADAFVRLVNRGGLNQSQYEARFREGGSLRSIADEPGVADAREHLRQALRAP